MKRIAAVMLALLCLLELAGCRQEQKQGDTGMQYFFSGKVTEVEENYLHIQVNDVGNTELSDGAEVEVSTDVVSARGCSEFSSGEYAKVLMARNAEGEPEDRLEALSVYKVDETGAIMAD